MSDDDKKQISIPLDIKTVALAVMFLGGGGGTAFALSPQSELEDLKKSIDVLSTAVHDVRAEMRSDRREFSRHADDYRRNKEDHEERIRDLEAEVRAR